MKPTQILRHSLIAALLGLALLTPPGFAEEKFEVSASIEAPLQLDFVEDPATAQERSALLIERLKSQGVSELALVESGDGLPSPRIEPLLVLLKENGIKVQRIPLSVAGEQGLLQAADQTFKVQLEALPETEKKALKVSGVLKQLRSRIKNVFGILHQKKMYWFLHKSPEYKRSPRDWVMTVSLVLAKFGLSAFALHTGVEQAQLKGEDLNFWLPAAFMMAWFLRFDTHPQRLSMAIGQGKMVEYGPQEKIQVKVNPFTSIAVGIFQSFVFREMLMAFSHLGTNGLSYAQDSGFWGAFTHVMGTAVFGTLAKIVFQVVVSETAKKQGQLLNGILMNTVGIVFSAVQVLDMYPTFGGIRSAMIGLGLTGLTLKFTMERRLIWSHLKRSLGLGSDPVAPCVTFLAVKKS